MRFTGHQTIEGCFGAVFPTIDLYFHVLILQQLDFSRRSSGILVLESDVGALSSLVSDACRTFGVPNTAAARRRHSHGAAREGAQASMPLAAMVVTE
ncbi:hypothetical protein [Methylobacterium sp. SD21]|uniref:hypothetical protein n=1 Tax=Methylobacterium litchii TaxID=3138810 RepID=UPI00313D65AB